MRPIAGNMIRVRKTTGMAIVICIEVCLISRMKFSFKENSRKKRFHAKPKHQYHVSHYRERDCSAHNKNNGDYYKLQIYLISWMTINYKESGGKKSFPTNPKHQYLASLCWKQDWSANNNRNGDY